MLRGTSFSMTNHTLALEVDLNAEQAIRSLSNLDSKRRSNQNRELFHIRIYGRDFCDRDFILAGVEAHEDQTQELITAWYKLPEQALQVKVHFINDREDTLRILFQVRDDYKQGVPYKAALRLPLLSRLEQDGDGDLLMAPGCQFRSLSGKKVLMPLRDYQYSSDIRPPLVLLGQDKNHGFSITFPSFSDLNNAGCCQNQNKFLAMIEEERVIREDEILIAPDASFNDTVELLITGLRRGWPEAFDRYRDFWAQNYDFSEYERKDLQWFYETAIHNFVFFYGKEGFDRSKEEIDVEGLLRQGEDFGGYDTVTIWNQYPRLGIDRRSQWAFHDDFPGGRAALRKAVDQFHARGVRVLLPYIPWDQGYTESTQSMGDEFAKLIADTDADGYQLDTMYDLPYDFRAKCDAVKPGVLLQTQFHPAKNHPIEFLTSSWDEFWRQEPMPEVDVLRFLLPQHLAPQISRWSRFEDKTLLIQRAVFGGAPLVIWQDVFGRWMPYSQEQKAMIKTWKNTYLKYRDIYQGPRPIPLYTTWDRGIFCNVFSDAGGRRLIYSFFNEDKCEHDTAVELWRPGTRVKEIFGSSSPEIRDGRLHLRIPPRQVVQVLVEAT